ncbi:MAG: thiamine pyrophosphate-binding protein [candidate division NC10 bacterium]|nr:thiamine pyrophosphate-binding protein [candidate division NC10 bacterium]
MPNCVETIADFLAGEGVQRLYGVPGDGASLDLLEAWRRRGLDFVLASDESAAAVMAATEGELLGRPGVCLVGPGAAVAGAARGLAQAFADRSPVLICTDRSTYKMLTLGPHRALDNFQVLRGVVKDGLGVSASRVDRLLSLAWRRAASSPGGPIHLDIPADEACRPVRGRLIRLPAAGTIHPSPTTIRSAARLLARRGRAVVIAGLACRGDRTVRALRELCAHLGAPVLTTPKAKGVIPEDHALSAGIFMGGRLDGRLLEKADSVLVVGLDPIEILAHPWPAQNPILALSAYRLGPRPFRPAVEVVGDLAESLTALQGGLPPAGAWGLPNWAAQAAKFKAEVRRLLAEASAGRHQAGVAPHRVAIIAREMLPRHARAVVDSGAHGLVVAHFWESFAPRAYLCSAGLEASGYALPAAVAVSLAKPGGHVVAFVGDGGFLASLGTLATAAHRRLPLTVIVFADQSLNLIRALQEQRRYAPLGVTLPSIDFPRLAEGLGALGIVVESETAFAGALADALAASQPAVIAVRIRPGGYRRVLDSLWGPP